MTKRFTRLRVVLRLFILTAGSAVPSFSQFENVSPDLSRKTNLSADIFYSLLDINISNLIVNFGARLAGNSYFTTTIESIAQNIYPGTWFWETGDRFLINQFGHPYQGSTYFASARINGFSFYQSIPFVLLGSFQWETTYEMDSSINDIITTTIGGVSLGEILHRLFLEVNSSPSVGAKIGGFFVNPIDSLNTIYHRPKREKGGGNTRGVLLKAGFEKSFPKFKGHQTEAGSWRNPGGRIGVNVIYGNPFTQKIPKPYDHFEISVDFTTNIASYNMQALSDGYIFSLAPSRTQKTFTSTGLTLHYDFFSTSNEIVTNVGYGNIQFSSNAIDWTVKHAIVLSERMYLSVKAHAGIVLWGASMYNDGVMSDGYLNNAHNTYGIGENLKLFFTMSHKKAGTMELAATGYHIFNMPVTATHSSGNTFFLNCSASYDIPVNERIGIGVLLRHWNLFGLYDAAENVYRRLMSAGVYTSFKF